MPQANNSYNRSRRKKKRKRRNRAKVYIARFIFGLCVLGILVFLFWGAYKVYAIITDGMSKNYEVTTVTVARNGSIKETIIEEFNPGFYDEASLKADVESKISASGGKVEYEGLDFSNGVATLKLEYETDDDMAAFNDEIFYADTIDNLVSQGVSFDSAAIKTGGTHAVIVSEPLDIRCPKKILYTGGAVTIDEDNEKLAHCTTEDGSIAFVIY